MSRADFGEPVKRKLALRAGYHCSICDIITVGPSDERSNSVNLTGEASHISGASSGPGSRRYDGNLSDEERSSIDNGIWLCSYHADLIDGDESTYTTDMLIQIKNNHEKRIKYKQSGINVEKGVITKIELSNIGPLGNIEFNCSEKNIIVGDNGAGKTLICEFIASLTDKSFLNRGISANKDVNSYFNLYFFKNELNKFSISINHRREVKYFFNDSLIPLLKIPISIVYLEQSLSDFEAGRKYDNYLHSLAGYFSLEILEFKNIIISISDNRKYFINDIKLTEDNNDFVIKLRSSFNRTFQSFGSLSGGEKKLVIVEIAIKIAEYYSRFNTTILIIEQSAIGILDITGINNILNEIRRNLKVQFIFTTVEEIDELDTTDYNIIKI